jgi:CubicO group peptidase (beta-lactamase class C family)
MKKILAIGCLLLLANSLSFADDSLPKREYWPTKDWLSSLPEKQGMDSVRLGEIDKYVKENLPLTSSILIVRHGYIVFERYYDNSPSNKRILFSATKGVLSALVGIAISNGFLIGADQKLLDVFPEYIDDKLNPKAYKITLRDLLTMSDGIAQHQMDSVFSQTRLKASFRAEPGTESFYNSMSPQIISMIITKATGTKAHEFARRYLFDRIGIMDAYWEDFGKHSRGALGLSLTSRDMARFGYLYLNMGTWDQDIIVHSDWVRMSTSCQIVNHQFNEYFQDSGFYWWIHPVDKYLSYYVEGYGGQFIVVIPELDIVTVITSEERTEDDEKYFLILPRIIAPSIR